MVRAELADSYQVSCDDDYILELGDKVVGPRSAGADGKADSPSAGGSLRGRPWLAVHWKCCGVYSRVYRNAAGTLYHGRCPRCGAPVKVKVGRNGTTARFFEAG